MSIRFEALSAVYFLARYDRAIWGLPSCSCSYSRLGRFTRPCKV